MAANKGRSLKIHRHHRDNKQVPELRLMGVWMEQLGFKIGETVQITTRDKLLIIEPLKAQAPEPDYKAALKEVGQTLKNYGNGNT